MQLKDYIQSNKRGKEANRLEREAMNDPFLQAALDGFDAVAGDHAKIIEELEKKYTTRTVVARNKRVFIYWAAAASIVLLIGFRFFFFSEKNENNIPVVAQNQSIENDSIISGDSTELSTQKQETLIAANTNKKTTQIQFSKSLDMESACDYAVAAAEVSVADRSGFSMFKERAYESSAKLAVKEQKSKNVRGKVLDETGKPLGGAVITQKGTNNGTFTDYDGSFSLILTENDSSKLIVDFFGYELKEIKPLDAEQTVILEPDNLALVDKVVKIGYSTSKRIDVFYTKEKSEISIKNTFGEEEFRNYFLQKANKNICDNQIASVEISFFIDKTGKPTEIECKSFSCEEAKKEMENLLSSSPVWTEKKRKVTMTIQW